MIPADRQVFAPWLVGVLLSAIFLQSFLASRVKSPAWDEVGGIAAGLSYWRTGKFTVNAQHPPLLKELSGLSMLIGGMRWPDTPEADRLLAGDASLQGAIAVGNDIIIRHGRDRALLW